MPVDEAAFQRWYAKQAKALDLDPNPDAPEHFYDYRGAFQAGAMPDKTGHWPSSFKREGHPRMVIDGVNTKTGEKVVPADVGYIEVTAPDGTILEFPGDMPEAAIKAAMKKRYPGGGSAEEVFSNVPYVPDDPASANEGSIQGIAESAPVAGAILGSLPLASLGAVGAAKALGGSYIGSKVLGAGGRELGGLVGKPELGQTIGSIGGGIAGGLPGGVSRLLSMTGRSSPGVGPMVKMLMEQFMGKGALRGAPAAAEAAAAPAAVSTVGKIGSYGTTAPAAASIPSVAAPGMGVSAGTSSMGPFSMSVPAAAAEAAPAAASGAIKTGDDLRKVMLDLLVKQKLSPAQTVSALKEWHGVPPSAGKKLVKLLMQDEGL